MPSSWYDLMMPPVNSLGWFAGISSPLKYPERETCFSKHSTNTTAQRLLNLVDCRITYSLLPPHPPLTFWSSSLPFLLLLPAPLLPWLVAPSRILAYASSDDPEYNVCVTFYLIHQVHVGWNKPSQYIFVAMYMYVDVHLHTYLVVHIVWEFVCLGISLPLLPSSLLPSCPFDVLCLAARFSPRACHPAIVTVIFLRRYTLLTITASVSLRETSWNTTAAIAHNDEHRIVHTLLQNHVCFDTK